MNNLNNTGKYSSKSDKYIYDVSFGLWEYGTCWVMSPVTDTNTTHKSRRKK